MFVSPSLGALAAVAAAPAAATWALAVAAFLTVHEIYNRGPELQGGLQLPLTGEAQQLEGGHDQEGHALRRGR
jgi:hypothetical protein